MSLNDYGAVTAFTAMLPIRSGAEAQVRALVAALPTDPSPFGALPDTHVARLTLLTDLPQFRRRRRPMAAHLMLAGDFSAPEATWLHALAGLRALHPVFGLCALWPGARDPEATTYWLLDHRVDSGFAILSYRAALGEVEQALATRAALAALARDTAELSPAELQRRFLATIG